MNIENRLLAILKEMSSQDMAHAYPEDRLGFHEEMNQAVSYIKDAGECGLAYEIIICALESKPFVLSGRASVSLLEVGLLMGYKTDRPEDEQFRAQH